MIDPDLVLARVVAAFSSITDLVTELGGLTDTEGDATIYGHTYSYGVEKSLAMAVLQQKSPSILVAYLDMIGGNFSGMTVWKHRLTAYIRPRNAASGGALTTAASPQHLFWLMMNKPVLGTTQNFRYVQLMEGLMMTDAMPSMTHQQDENGADLFQISLVLPEHGDA